MGPEYYTQEGMRAQLEEWLRRFREDQPDTIMEWVPLYLHDCDFQKRTMTVCVDPTPWMADRTGGMSNGAFSVALDETMGILCVYFVDSMTPTITMQMSLLRPIPIDRRLYIKVKLLGTDGTKIAVSATAWSEGDADHPVCTAMGIYYGYSRSLAN